jgi:hypothetical protein
MAMCVSGSGQGFSCLLWGPDQISLSLLGSSPVTPLPGRVAQDKDCFFLEHLEKLLWRSTWPHIFPRKDFIFCVCLFIGLEAGELAISSLANVDKEYCSRSSSTQGPEDAPNTLSPWSSAPSGFMHSNGLLFVSLFFAVLRLELRAFTLSQSTSSL